jgi:1,4-dihydroxy-2-naphthoyl-CoA hydrolase
MAGVCHDQFMTEHDRVHPDTLTTIMPFLSFIGVQALTVTPAEVVLRLEWHPDRCTAGGIMHGGALMALADGAGAWCAFLNLPDGAAGTTTIESKTNFIRGVANGHVDAHATILHGGRTTIVVDTELRNHENRLVGRVTQTQAVLMPRG